MSQTTRPTDLSFYLYSSPSQRWLCEKGKKKSLKDNWDNKMRWRAKVKLSYQKPWIPWSPVSGPWCLEEFFIDSFVDSKKKLDLPCISLMHWKKAKNSINEVFSMLRTFNWTLSVPIKYSINLLKPLKLFIEEKMIYCLKHFQYMNLARNQI